MGYKVATLFFLALSLSCCVMAGFWYFLRPEIAKPVLFDFVLCLSYINLEGAYFYFYTDEV